MYSNNLVFEKEWEPGKQCLGYLFHYTIVEISKKAHISISSIMRRPSINSNILQEKDLDNSDIQFLKKLILEADSIRNGKTR